jgi:hypothetical protein
VPGTPTIGQCNVAGMGDASSENGKPGFDFAPGFHFIGAAARKLKAAYSDTTAARSDHRFNKGRSLRYSSVYPTIEPQ